MKTLKLKEWPRRVSIGTWSAILLIATGTQTLVLPPLQGATTKKEITDSGITSTVERELRIEKGVSLDLIDVSTSQGIATISGSVANLLDKERAVKIAETIRGVRGVIDRITVDPGVRPDEDIRKDILTALRQDPTTESYQVGVSVRNSVATLTGSVGSYAEEQLAARVAKGVKGLNELINDVTINYRAKRPDSEIAAEIKACLKWDIWINGGVIYPEAKNGTVTLTGTVGSAISQSRAFDDAWVNGVTAVDDSGLKVEPDVRPDTHRKSEYRIRTDSEIRQAVQTALHLDPRVSAFFPDVTVEGGVVILGGSVGSLKAKTAAAQDARNVVGASLVENFLKVRPKQQPTDKEIETQLNAALFWDPLLDSSTIGVAVINGVAHLSGRIDTGFQKAEAQDVASRTKGVLLVRNYLKVAPEFSISNSDYDWPFYTSYGWPYYNQPPSILSETSGLQPYLSDEYIKKYIEDAFFWSPFVDRDDIIVTVDGGVATLTGTAGTWIGYGEADKDAHRSGARAVRNRIKVKEVNGL